MALFLQPFAYLAKAATHPFPVARRVTAYFVREQPLQRGHDGRIFDLSQFPPATWSPDAVSPLHTRWPGFGWLRWGQSRRNQSRLLEFLHPCTNPGLGYSGCFGYQGHPSSAQRHRFRGGPEAAHSLIHRRPEHLVFLLDYVEVRHARPSLQGHRSFQARLDPEAEQTHVRPNSSLLWGGRVRREAR